MLRWLRSMLGEITVSNSLPAPVKSISAGGVGALGATTGAGVEFAGVAEPGRGAATTRGGFDGVGLGAEPAGVDPVCGVRRS